VDYDVLVIGSGIGGMESALKLGDMGYRVLVVEKEASVGGKMILLSKVFPTLDCSSCISTPKMGATIHHPNVSVFTCSEVEGIRRNDGGRFRAKIRRKPRFVDEALCTGCRLCEPVCTVSVPDQFNADLVARRAAHIPFPQAVPLKALIERPGTSPCTSTCPAGIKAHGYVSLIRSGEYEKAFDLVLEATPLVGTLGRACYAPCENECTRGSLEGPVPIRRLKRFAADAHYANGNGAPIEVPPPNGQRVAVIGSGPAGLTAAWQLARLGYRVKIFEAAPEPGGMLRLAIPSYRLPTEVVERDIRNVTDIGVEIATSARVEDVDELKGRGFDAILLATGTPLSTRLGVPGEDLSGVCNSLEFLRAVKLGEAPDLHGKRVVVVGGGDCAMDAARSALRLGAEMVHLVYRRTGRECPARAEDLRDAIEEGVECLWLTNPARILGSTDGRVNAVEILDMELGEPDESGRPRPVPKPGTEHLLPADLVIPAVGMRPDADAFAERVTANKDRTIPANPRTLQTSVPYLFAAGDVVSGPLDIAHAVGQGRRAAFMIDHWLRGEDLEAVAFDLDDGLPVVDKAEVLARQRTHSRREPPPAGFAPVPRPASFDELEPPMSEEEARASAGRCLDCGVCSECGQCVAACPANAIDLSMREREVDIEVGAVILSTGFKLFPADAKPQYGYGRFSNVITGMQMERLLAPTRPYHTVLRPGDGKVPERIAYVLCTGSRDQSVGNPLCSKFCCMYSLKQNQLIMGALPLADVTVHYIDIRAAGKGYDEFFEQAKAMGATFIKGRVAEITQNDDGDLLVRYEDVEGGGGLAEAEYDLVVLAVGVQPNREVLDLFEDDELAADARFYVEETDEDLNPGATTIPGVYVAGAASGPRDIPESILHAGAAVVQAVAHLERRKVPA
jgi:heterodisulfide reductase subunit A